MNTTSAATSLDDEAPIIVFLIGGPGSGKTTQAEALAGDDDSKSVRVYVFSFFQFFFSILFLGFEVFIMLHVG